MDGANESESSEEPQGDIQAKGDISYINDMILENSHDLQLRDIKFDDITIMKDVENVQYTYNHQELERAKK